MTTETKRSNTPTIVAAVSQRFADWLDETGKGAVFAELLKLQQEYRVARPINKGVYFTKGQLENQLIARQRRLDRSLDLVAFYQAQVEKFRGLITETEARLAKFN